MDRRYECTFLNTWGHNIAKSGGWGGLWGQVYEDIKACASLQASDEM